MSLIEIILTVVGLIGAIFGVTRWRDLKESFARSQYEKAKTKTEKRIEEQGRKLKYAKDRAIMAHDEWNKFKSRHGK